MPTVYNLNDIPKEVLDQLAREAMNQIDRRWISRVLTSPPPDNSGVFTWDSAKVGTKDESVHIRMSFDYVAVEKPIPAKDLVINGDCRKLES